VEKTVIDSLEVLHQHLPKIIEEINASPALALAAAANPLHAMEELGYQIAPQARAQIEDHIRFKPVAALRLANLRQQIFKMARRPFNLNAPHELHRVLCEELKVSREEPRQAQELVLAATPLSPYEIDPLERFRDDHPIMEPLLEYRCLDASSPRLADLDLYRAIRKGNGPAANTRAHYAFRKVPD